MRRRKVGRSLAVLAMAIAVVLVVSTLTLGSPGDPRGIFFLGIGVSCLALSLIFLQLSFWREGDQIARVSGKRQPLSDRAPKQLRHPRFRNVWETMEETRKLMERKEESATEIATGQEKLRLGLPEEELILTMGEPSWHLFWPIALVSAILLFTSAWISDEIHLAFVCLFAGLGGLLLLAIMKGRTRYYLTNFRVLIRQKPVGFGAVRWSAVRYSDVERYSCKNGAGRGTVTLQGDGKILRLSGLASRQFEAVMDILGRRLPARVLSQP